jgi:cbb3-type cytochrome oxidase subunit 3
MFKRMIAEDWAYFIPFVSFFIFAVVFIAVTIRALRIGKAERDRLASLPLENNAETSNPETP